MGDTTPPDSHWHWSGRASGDPPSMPPEEGAQSFPGLLPAPVRAADKMVRRISWLAIAATSALVLLVGAFLLGWLVGEEGSEHPVEIGNFAGMPAAVALADLEEEPVVAVAESVAPSVVLVVVPETSQGSGILLDNDGRVVTNAHVVDALDEVQVLLPSGRSVAGEVIGADVRRDVAVVQLLETDESLKVATFAPSDQLRVGQLAVAVGSPFGLSQTVTAGIISAVARVVPSYGCQVAGMSSAECADVSMLQTDAPINPGNSGGPLADRAGRVIGMNTSIRTQGFSNANVGVGFAIPSDTVLLVAERLILGEPVGTAFLGISGVTPRDGRVGALIKDIVEDSPADIAGLKDGDLIVGSDGRPIPDMRALRADIQLRLPGTRVELKYLRGEQIAKATVELASLDEELQNAK